MMRFWTISILALVFCTTAAQDSLALFRGGEGYVEVEERVLPYYFTYVASGVDIALKSPQESRPGSARLPLHIEFGGHHFAIPFSFSAGGRTMLIGLKPRAQWVRNFVEEWKNTFFGPGAGLSLNYISHSKPGTRVNTIEAGVSASFQIIYLYDKRVQIQFSPAAFDINFLRFNSAKGGTDAENKSNSQLGLVYTMVAGLGLIF